MIRAVQLTGKFSPMPSPFQRGHYVLTLECGHLYSAKRELPFPDPFDWLDAPNHVDCVNCDKPERPWIPFWEWPVYTDPTQVKIIG